MCYNNNNNNNNNNVEHIYRFPILDDRDHLND